jgi:hypothetical protein
MEARMQDEGKRSINAWRMEMDDEQLTVYIERMRADMTRGT